MCVTSVVRSRMRSLCTSRRVCTRRGRVDGDCVAIRGACGAVRRAAPGCVACARSAMCVTSVVRSRMLRSLCTSRRVCTRRGRVDGDCVAIRGACGAVRRAAPGCVACARSAMCVTSVVRSRMPRSLCTSRRVCTRRGRVDGDCVAIRGACGAVRRAAPGCVACARSAMCVTSVVRSRMPRSLCTSRRVCTRRPSPKSVGPAPPKGAGPTTSETGPAGNRPAGNRPAGNGSRRAGPRRAGPTGQVSAGNRPRRSQAFAAPFGLRTKSVSVCSSSMPFVSGMRRAT